MAKSEMEVSALEYFFERDTNLISSCFNYEKVQIFAHFRQNCTMSWHF